MPNHSLHSTLRTLTLAGITAAALLASSAAAAAETEIRALNGSIQSILLSGPIDIQINQGETRGVELEGSPEIRARVKIETEGGELRLSLKPEENAGFGWSTGSKIRARVALPVLTQVLIKGSGDVVIGSFDLKRGELQLNILGSGDIKAEALQAAAVRSSIRGSGDIWLGGQVETQAIAIAGSGDYDATNLQSRSASVSIAGSGDAQVWATDALDVSIAGSGDVSYKGSPKLTQSIRGSGEVRAR